MAKRRRFKTSQKRYIWLIAAVLIVVVALFYFYDVYSTYSTRIGVIRIDGEVIDFSYADQIENALKDPRIRAVVVVIDSPGGTVEACFETEERLSKLRAEKPVVVTMGQYAASGAYLIASASDYIFARNQTVTAGLGVIAVWISYENKFQKEGIEYFVWRSGEAKDEFAPWRAPTPEENERIQRLVDDLMEELIDRIKKNRPKAELEDLMDGSTVYGWEALKYNLIDEIGNYESALRKAAELANLKEGEYIVAEVINPPSFWGAIRRAL
ncbi:MAG: signal peptide peptidase SppA [Hadesarchaea archaeon]|nr:signal peptide peptidase SppA [Hadesarchaea archaeon]